MVVHEGSVRVLKGFVYMYIYIYTYTWICVYITYIYIYSMHIHIYIYIYMCVCVYSRILGAWDLKNRSLMCCLFRGFRREV